MYPNRGSFKGSYKGSFKGYHKGLGYKGPCTQIVYTLAPKYLYKDYFKAKVYTIWVHGPLGVSYTWVFRILNSVGCVSVRVYGIGLLACGS